MADEEHKDTSNSAGATRESQDETTRITMLPKIREVPQPKHSSMEINDPVKAAEGVSSGGESEKSVRESEAPKAVVHRVKPPQGFSKPSVPPPVPKVPLSNSPSVPKPPKTPLTGGSVSRPPVVPKPPALGSKPAKLPTALQRPSSVSSGGTDLKFKQGAELEAPERRQAARIQVPAQSREVLRTPTKTEQPSSMGAPSPVATEAAVKRGDSLMTGLAIIALLASALTLVLSYLVFISA